MQALAPDAEFHGLTQRAVVQHWEVSIHITAKEIERLLRDRFGQQIMVANQGVAKSDKTHHPKDTLRRDITLPGMASHRTMHIEARSHRIRYKQMNPEEGHAQARA